jgi:hypothetical protein
MTSAPNRLGRFTLGFRILTLLCLSVSQDLFLGTFAKLRKATINLVASFCSFVCSSVRMEQLGSHWTDFDEIWYLSFFRKSVDKIQIFLKSDMRNGYLTWFYFTFMTISRWILLRMRNVLTKNCRKIKTQLMFSNFYPKIVLFMR